MRPHLWLLLSLLLVAGSCAAPGTDIQRAPGDFAFLQVQLRG